MVSSAFRRALQPEGWTPAESIRRCGPGWVALIVLSSYQTFWALQGWSPLSNLMVSASRYPGNSQQKLTAVLLIPITNAAHGADRHGHLKLRLLEFRQVEETGMTRYKSYRYNMVIYSLTIYCLQIPFSTLHQIFTKVFAAASSMNKRVNDCLQRIFTHCSK